MSFLYRCNIAWIGPYQDRPRMWGSSHSPKFILIGIGDPSWIPNSGWDSNLNTDLNRNSKLNGWSVGRVQTPLLTGKDHGHLLIKSAQHSLHGLLNSSQVCFQNMYHFHDWPQHRSYITQLWTLSWRINCLTWNSNLNLYSTWNSNLSLVFNLAFQFQWR